MSELPLWADAHEKPFPADISGESMELNRTNTAVALFRRRPYMDYLAIRHEDESWTFCFDKHDLIYWMGGIALLAADREDIRHAESKLGSFYKRYGWNPDVVIEDYPSQNELDVYVNYVTQDLQETIGLPEDDDVVD